MGTNHTGMATYVAMIFTIDTVDERALSNKPSSELLPKQAKSCISL